MAARFNELIISRTFCLADIDRGVLGDQLDPWESEPKTEDIPPLSRVHPFAENKTIYISTPS